MKHITLVSEYRVGLLADISYVLGKAGIPIEGLHVDVLGQNAVILIMVNDPQLAATSLMNNGYDKVILDSLVIKVTGSLKKISDILKEEQITIHEFSEVSSDLNSGIFSIRVDKPRRAARVLGSFIFGNLPDPYPIEKEL